MNVILDIKTVKISSITSVVVHVSQACVWGQKVLQAPVSWPCTSEAVKSHKKAQPSNREHETMSWDTRSSYDLGFFATLVHLVQAIMQPVRDRKSICVKWDLQLVPTANQLNLNGDRSAGDTRELDRLPWFPSALATNEEQMPTLISLGRPASSSSEDYEVLLTFFLHVFHAERPESLTWENHFYSGLYVACSRFVTLPTLSLH